MSLRNFIHKTLAGLLALGFVLTACGGTPPSTLSFTRLALDPSLGPANAKVTIVEYGDFGCTTCLGWERAGVRQQILAKYGDQVRFVWRDYPIITAQSPKAAEAGQCASDQGKFWEYHDLLYQKAPALSVSDLKAYAAGLGLDAARFDDCLDSGQDAPKVNQSWQEAKALGFVGTPAFVINGEKLAGPGDLATFSRIIDPLLAAGG
ncbi:MAG TPA: thioredoxin domain-containing protein [Anaerolineales bacterium]|nr:thioredoxin domain-containing protein [Anaerolineales bacterium]